MSPLTGLARLPGRILWSVHMENCSPVDRDEIQDTKPKWWNLNLYRSRVVQGGGGGGGGRSLARFTNRKNSKSRITDIKISFSRITKINKSGSFFNNLFLHLIHGKHAKHVNLHNELLYDINDD